MERLLIENLGPIERADVAFGDLTFLVGPQASGKSIFLQTFKLVADRDKVIDTMDRYNYILGHNPAKILNVFYGEGMSDIWKSNTSIICDNTPFDKKQLPKKTADDSEASVFYVPAQRVVCMGDGYPRFFSDFSFTTPYVMREFAEILRTFMQFGLGSQNRLFPLNNRIKFPLRNLFDSTIFHGGQVVMAESAGQKKMQLDVDGVHIPFMAWSAGQKEFMPLLMAFYCLSGPPSKVIKRNRYTTVIVEEPEMGLHPQAIVSVMLQIMELLHSGYKVVVSTHSSLLLEWAWVTGLLSHSKEFGKALCQLFEIDPATNVGKMLSHLNGKVIRTYYFDRQQSGKVVSQDISTLDLYSDNRYESEWGGLTKFSNRAADVISQYYNAEEAAKQA